MTEYILVTHIPSRQGWVGPIQEKYLLDECEAESIEDLKARTHVPLGGKVLVIRKEDVTTFTSRIINEVADE